MDSIHDAYRKEFALNQRGRAILAEKDRDGLRAALAGADRAMRRWRVVAVFAVTVAVVSAAMAIL